MLIIDCEKVKNTIASFYVGFYFIISGSGVMSCLLALREKHLHKNVLILDIAPVLLILLYLFIKRIDARIIYSYLLTKRILELLLLFLYVFVFMV